MKPSTVIVLVTFGVLPILAYFGHIATGYAVLVVGTIGSVVQSTREGA